MSTQHFYADGRYLGAATRTWEHWHNQVADPVGYAFFCPVCIEIWARCPIESNGQPALTMVQTISCRKHPAHHGIGVPGSLMLPWDKTFTECLPDDAVRRELEVHLDYAEKRGMRL